MKEPEGHEEAETERLLQEKCAPSNSWSTEYSRFQVMHSPSSPSSYGEDGDDYDNDDDDGEENTSHRHHNNKQPRGKHCHLFL